MFATILIPVADDACNWDALELARNLARTVAISLKLLYLIPAQAPVYVVPEMDQPTFAVSQGYAQVLARHRAALECEGLRILADDNFRPIAGEPLTDLVAWLWQHTQK